MKETISREEFNNMDREVLYTLFTGMQEQLRRSDETIDALKVTVDKLNEQLKILNGRMFGKSTEKSLAPSDQLSIYDFGLNEAELAEREVLRREYREAFRRNLVGTLEHTVIVDKDGNVIRRVADAKKDK